MKNSDLLWFLLLAHFTVSGLLYGQVDIPLEEKIATFNNLLLQGSKSEALTTAEDIARTLLQSGNFEMALEYYDQVADLAQDQQLEDLLKTALSAKAGIFRQQQDHYQLIEVNRQLIRLQTAGPTPLLSTAESYLHLEMPDSALSYLQQVSRAGPDGITSSQLTRLNNGFAQAYLMLDHPDRAELFLRKNLSHSTGRNDTFQIALALREISRLQIRQNRLSEADRSVNTAIGYAGNAGLKMLETDLLKLRARIKARQGEDATALRMYDRILTYYRTTKQYLEEAAVHESIARLQLRQGNSGSALKHFRAALSTFKEQDKGTDVVNCQLNIAEILRTSGHPERAIPLLENSKGLAEGTGDHPTLHRIYGQLRKAHAHARNYRAALANYRRQVMLRDTILQLAQSKMIKELETKFEFEKAEKNILELESRSLHKANQLQQQSWYILILGVFLCFLLGLAIFYYRNWSKTGIILRQQDEINLRKIQELEKGKKVLSLKSMIEGQERERKRIAHDLHDGLGGLLSTVKLQFDVIDRDGLSLLQKNAYLEGRTLLDNACAEVRKMAHNMMPSAIAKFGLPAAIRDLCKVFAGNNRIEVDFHAINWAEELPENRSVALYRIIQDTLDKLIRSTRTTEVIVQLARHGEELHLTIEHNDDTPTFSEKEIYRNPIYRSILTRVDYLNGKMETDWTPGHGKAFLFTFPAR